MHGHCTPGHVGEEATVSRIQLSVQQWQDLLWGWGRSVASGEGSVSALVTALARQV